MTHVSDYEAFMIDKLHHIGWVIALKKVLNTDNFKRLGGFVAKRRQETKVFPASDAVFRAFETKLDDIKVVILGQD